jgi:SAM-dependent methyltransferase
MGGIKFKCKICDNKNDNNIIIVKEMMFGSGEYFDYLECSKCGCLQIIEIPENMGQYYPIKSYYSFSTQKRLLNSFKKILNNKRIKYCIFGNDIIGKLVNIKYPFPFYSILKKLNLTRQSKILDVGCGAGVFLYQLKDLHFENLLGIDPFINREIEDESVNILKKNIYNIDNEQKFDFILFNDSFEHIEDPVKTIKKVRNILSTDGICIIKMPIKTDYIWNLYREHWAQIDAPRHLFIQTIKSFKILLKKSDLILEEMIFDSYLLQFLGSEQNKRGIPSNANNSYYQNSKKSIFTKTHISEFKKRSKKLNKENLGDHAIFMIKKIK